MNGLDVDVESALDPHFFGDCGVPGSTELLGFASAVTSAASTGDRSTADEARAAVRLALGDEALAEAAATVAAFCGLVRVADGTGIPLDDGVLAVSADLRARSGIDRFGGAESSDTSAGSTATVADGARADVAALFR